MSLIPVGWPKLWWGSPEALGNGDAASFSPIKDQIIDLHDLVLVIITVITLFVAALLVWVMVRYNARRNPMPSQTSHNTVLEIAWTVMPVLILVIIAIPSFRLIYYQDRTAEPRHDHQGDRASVVLGIHLSGSGQSRLRKPHHPR